MMIQDLTERFMKFPGIGPRQARRFVYYLLRINQKMVADLVRAIIDLKKTISRCQECYRFFLPSSTAPANNKQLICEICQDRNRDKTLLLLVEKDIDLENIEKSGVYRGDYFVLGGLVPILDPQPTRRFRAKELREKIKRQAVNSSLREIILALSANQEGDQTVEFLKKFLAPLVVQYSLQLSVLGRGLSTGTELEYSDSETLKNALKNRG